MTHRFFSPVRLFAFAMMFFFASVFLMPVTVVDAAEKNLRGAKDNFTTIAEKVGIPTDESNTVESVVARLIQAVLGLAGMVFLVRTVLAGILIGQSTGNSDKMGEAKTMMKNSVIALLVLFSAAAVTEVVLNVLSS